VRAGGGHQGAGPEQRAPAGLVRLCHVSSSSYRVRGRKKTGAWRSCGVDVTGVR
jgi:hypothetical protein